MQCRHLRCQIQALTDTFDQQERGDFANAGFDGRQPDQLAVELREDLFDADAILVVHSNRLTRRRYSRVLGSSYQVIEADTGERALDVLFARALGDNGKNNSINFVG